MLKLIYGRSGTGKTEYIIDYLCSLTKETDEKLMLIIPEQHSFSTEKKIIEKIGPRLAQKIEVLSFSRIADAVFRRSGGYPETPVSEGMRNIFMSLALRECRDELVLYHNQINKPDFIPVILNTINEMKSCAISPDELMGFGARAKNETLKNKLKDLALISSVYNSLLNRAYSDPLDNLTLIYNRLLENNIFENYIIALDAFSGFTKQELLIVELLMRDSKEMLLTLCGNTADFSADNDVFSVSNETRKAIMGIAKKNFISVAAPIELKENIRLRTEALKELEMNIYSFSRPNSAVDSDGVTVYCGESVYDECNYAASEIKRLVAEEDYRYSDIAVICRDLTPYRGILGRAFDKHEISYFMENPSPLIQKPLPSYLLSVLDIICTSFSSEHIFRMLKTGYAPLDDEAIFELENYTYIWNISGSKWLEPFDSNPSGFKSEFSQNDKKALEDLEKSRKAIISPLLEFRDRVKNASGGEITRQLYLLIEKNGIKDRLREEEEVYIENNDTQRLSELDRIWDALVKCLDSVYSALEDIPLGIKEYTELLRLCLGAEDISYIPQSLDEVTVGTADRIRTDSPRAVFLLGCIQDEFPKAPVAAGVFTDNERCLLREQGLGLYASVSGLAANELYYAYTAISAPTERLYSSCYSRSLSGEDKAASSIIREIVSILGIMGGDNFITERHDGRFIRCEQDAFEFLAMNFDSDDPLISGLKKYFKGTDRAPAVEKIETLIEKRPPDITDRSVARRLFGERNIELSASQIEKYYLCPYEYFCTYGLNLKERKRAEINAAEFGTLVHYILEVLLSKNSVREIDELINEGKLKDKIQEIIYGYLNTYLGGGDNKTKRFLYALKRIEEGTEVLVRYVVSELMSSSFDPFRFELKIDCEERGGEVEPVGIELDDGTRISVRGFVDRVDKCERGDGYYIRVIDYKTNNKEFKINQIDFGLNLQMLLYLKAIAENGEKSFNKKIIPSGVLYMPSSPKLIAKNDGKEEIDRSYAMNGVLLDEPELADAYSPDKNMYMKGTTRMSSGELKICFDKIETLILNMVKKLLDGNIAPLPVKTSDSDSCKYCPYINSCGFESGMTVNDLKNKGFSPIYGAEEAEK